LKNRLICTVFDAAVEQIEKSLAQYSKVGSKVFTVRAVSITVGDHVKANIDKIADLITEFGQLSDCDWR